MQGQYWSTTHAGLILEYNTCRVNTGVQHMQGQYWSTTHAGLILEYNTCRVNTGINSIAH